MMIHDNGLLFWTTLYEGNMAPCVVAVMR